MLYGRKENSIRTNCLAACTHLSSTVSQLFEPQVQKIAVFTAPTFLFSLHGDAPAIIMQYVAWVERQSNACQTARSMYLSSFNSFWVLRCLSQCVSPKIAILPHYFPWGRPGAITLNVVWTEREIDAYKLPRCMCPSNYNRLWDRARYWSKIVIFSYPLAFDAPVRGAGGFPSDYRHPVWCGKTRMVWLPDGEKI